MGAAEVLILLGIVSAIGVLFFALPIWAIVDAAQRPGWQYQATGQSKTVWIVLPAVTLVLCWPVSAVAAIVYLASVRPKLQRAIPRDDRWTYGHGDPYRSDYPPPPPSPEPRRPGPPRA